MRSENIGLINKPRMIIKMLNLYSYSIFSNRSFIFDILLIIPLKKKVETLEKGKANKRINGGFFMVEYKYLPEHLHNEHIQNSQGFF